MNKLLSVGGSGGDLGTGRVVERPHVLWNEGTGEWVMVCFLLVFVSFAFLGVLGGV